MPTPSGLKQQSFLSLRNLYFVEGQEEQWDKLSLIPSFWDDWNTYRLEQIGLQWKLSLFFIVSGFLQHSSMYSMYSFHHGGFKINFLHYS